MIARPRALHADRINESGSQGRTDECEPHVAGDVARSEHDDSDHHGKRRAGIHAEDTWFGEGVAGERLHHYPGDGQGRANQERKSGSWDPQLPNDDRFAGLINGAESMPDFWEAERFGPNGKTEEDAQRDGDRPDSYRRARSRAVAGDRPTFRERTSRVCLVCPGRRYCAHIRLC